ncbi:glycosyltransferase [Polaribacter sp. Z014]|uniref:glycosyltransferase n=1 Tax=Polaribacter sp. Z014 TaxID=2927126 RepID=UPI002021B910|nr:glycosyltransferase [Polaribacter sp. Z014]MCL7764207.1 glycosyltransferase [Polaribacter sp. Z014]
MRVNYNPNKDLKGEIKSYKHRIIIPVYIPELSNYHINALEILKISINTLLDTISFNSAITVVNNGSCKEVVAYLNDLFLENRIQDLIHAQKIGKLNSIIKALKSSSEPLITITDADVYFKPNWLSKTMDVFNNFPKAGVVGIVPQFKQYENWGYNIIFDNLFNSNINFTEVNNANGLIKFYKSIGWNDDYNKSYLKYNLTVKSNIDTNLKAVIGSGHFVATYKRKLFDSDLKFTDYLLGGNTEGDYLDKPCVKKDLWRLTTNGNYGYHMGNILEPWMKDKIDYSLQDEISIDLSKETNEIVKDKFFYFLLKTILMRLFYKRFKSKFYKKWGLPKELHSTY